MEYWFTSAALRDLKKLPKAVQRRIFAKLDFYMASGKPLEFAQSLKDKILGGFRFRIGEYRVIFDVDRKQNRLTVLTLGHRRDVYR